MSSPYGWGITPKQPSQAGESKPTPPQTQPSQAAGYSQKQEAHPSQAAGYSQPQQSQQAQQAPTYGFNLPSQQERQSTPQYGFAPQQQEQRAQEQPAPQYGFSAQQQEQSSPQYGFAPQQQQYQQPASQPTEPYGQAPQQYAGAPAQQYQPGINAQQGYYPSMQEQFDNNDKYNTKAILGLIFTFLFWPAGLVLSIMARNEIDKNGGKGKGFTTASFILCGISAVSTVLLLILTSMGLFSLGHHTVYTDPYTGYLATSEILCLRLV